MSLSCHGGVLNRSQAAGNRAEADRPLVILVDDDDSLASRRISRLAGLAWGREFASRSIEVLDER